MTATPNAHQTPTKDIPPSSLPSVSAVGRVGGMIAPLLLAVALLSSGPMTLERAEAYRDCKRASAFREKTESQEALKQARSSLAKARRSGGNISSQAAAVASAAKRVKEAANPNSEPLLEETPELGKVGRLRINEGRFYQRAGRTGDELVLSPHIAATFASVSGRAGSNPAIEKGTPISYSQGSIPDPEGVRVIVRVPVPIGGDPETFTSKQVFEVVGHRDGMPILEPFDVQAAKDLLAKQKP